MKKLTGFFIIGIGITSIISGIYKAILSGELIDSLYEVLIGIALVGIILIELNEKEKIK